MQLFGMRGKKNWVLSVEAIIWHLQQPTYFRIPVFLLKLLSYFIWLFIISSNKLWIFLANVFPQYLSAQSTITPLCAPPIDLIIKWPDIEYHCLLLILPYARQSLLQLVQSQWHGKLWLWLIFPRHYQDFCWPNEDWSVRHVLRGVSPECFMSLHFISPMFRSLLSPHSLFHPPHSIPYIL